MNYNFSELTKRLDSIDFANPNTQKTYLVTSEKDNKTRKDIVMVAPSKYFLYNGKNAWKITDKEVLPNKVTEDIAKEYTTVISATLGNSTWSWNFTEYLVTNKYGYKVSSNEYIIKSDKIDAIKEYCKKIVVNNICLIKTTSKIFIGKKILY